MRNAVLENTKADWKAINIKHGKHKMISKSLMLWRTKPHYKMTKKFNLLLERKQVIVY